MSGNKADALHIAMLNGEPISVLSNQVNFTSLQSFTLRRSFTPGTLSVLVVQNPLGAPDSIMVFLQCVVPSQATSRPNIVTDWNYNICFVSDIFIPLNPGVETSPPTTGDNDTIPKNYDLGRVVSGRLDVRCTQTSTTLAALSGTITAAIGFDLRSMLLSAVTPSTLVQSSLSQKDIILQGNIIDGVTAIVATDISASHHAMGVAYTMPPRNTVSWSTLTPPTNDANTVFSVSTTTAESNPGLVLITPGYVVGSPTQTTAITSVVVTCPPPSIFASPEFRFTFRLSGAGPTAPAPQFVTMIHYFASYVINGIGTPVLTVSSVSEACSLIQQTTELQTFWAGGTTGTQPASCLEPATNFVTTIPYQKNMLWIYSAVQLYLPAGAQSLQMGPVEYRESQSDWTGGPQRCMLVQNMSDGQQLSIVGALTAEYSPYNNLAPYVGQKVPHLTMSSAELEAMRVLFNDPSLADKKRIFITNEAGSSRKRFRETQSRLCN